MNASLNQALKRFEKLIVKNAESLEDPQERQTEFLRRLERTRRLLGLLGNPQEGLDIIHIGGTSGKGSTAMMCEAVLLAGGLSVGTHTTPYLQTPLEKVRVGGRLADPSEIIRLSDQVMDAVHHLQQTAAYLGSPHYAEAWLGLALLHFASQQCNAAVIEVGMGGRFDSTNVITPRVSVISTVHYDHVRVLGDTLSEIAFHKAGIIKPGVPVVVGEMPDEALQVINDEAQLRGARLIHLGEDVNYRCEGASEHCTHFDYDGLSVSLQGAEVNLMGAHQITNAAAALAALEIFSETTGTELSASTLEEGLSTVRFAGRLEVMQHHPTVVLDGAHNEEKMTALTTALGSLFDYEQLIIVLGMLEAKNARPIVEKLGALADVIITTAPSVKGKPAIRPREVAEMVREENACQVFTDDHPLEAMTRALALAGERDLVVGTGSLYLIGTLRSHWHAVNEIVRSRTMFPNQT